MMLYIQIQSLSSPRAVVFDGEGVGHGRRVLEAGPRPVVHPQVVHRRVEGRCRAVGR